MSGTAVAHAWTLAARPRGVPVAADFRLREFPLPALAEGQVLVRNLWLSVDPYMRGRMDARQDSYIAPFALDAPMDGAAIGDVVASRSPRFAMGDLVQHFHGWRDMWMDDAAAFAPVPTDAGPPERYLGALGMVGATAYFGLLHVGAAQPGETLLVSAAAGAVGSLVVQIGKRHGMRVIGSAGGADKCAWVRALGADAVVDYKAPGDFLDKLRAVVPEGIDVYFDNVGGEQLDAALALARDHARIPVCGMIGMYNASEPVALRHLFRVIAARIRIQGFLVGDFRARMPEFRADMARWLDDGSIVVRDTVVEGLERMPEAFISLFHGANIGKLLVRA